MEFERVFHKLVHYALNELPVGEPKSESPKNSTEVSQSDLVPAFFNKLSQTNNWKEFEEYTFYLLKLLGIQTAYNFLDERQAGKADGFFKLGNLAVIYDCTLDQKDFENTKSEQIVNYCNRLKQGNIEISERTTEEFYDHHKQVWIITQGKTRRVKLVSSIEVKEISVDDLMNLYQERLTTTMNDQALELRLRNL